MMKITKQVSIFLSLILLISLGTLPLEVEAKTISEFEAEVNKYTKELQEKKDKMAKNNAEVAQIKARINEIENQIATINEQCENLQKEIEESNKKIIEKTQESKKIMEYYQISNGENAYLEYAFGATDITDMIYRMSVVEQLTEYNKKIMGELQALIESNKQKTIELNTKKEELNKLEVELKSEKERIDADTASIKETMPTIEEQIKAAKANVTYYKNLGCGATEDIQACQYRKAQSSGGSIPSVNGYFRPMEYGYITQGYVGSSGHLGVDLSSSDKKIPIYPIASGQLFFAGYDSAGALIVVLRHNSGSGYIYSTYAHLSSFSGAVSSYVEYKRGSGESIVNGPFISSSTVIGNMGSTGNSSGPHLHLEVTKCQWRKRGGCSSYDKKGGYIYQTISPGSLFALPSRWNNR